ncbi:MAG TPA: condensation domain-containing protein, partial [Ktedonobacteraceae bacterium]|nr:condensation domain-containing protein [Ktedonobacteraceae bacterium]
SLERALRAIVERHEILRTSYFYDGKQALQVIGTADTFCLQRRDLRFVESSKRQDEVNRFIHEEAEYSFDLTVGPLFRATLLQLEAEREYILLITMHHIVADAWSLQIFQHELAALYIAFTQGQPTSLPELPLQYADFAQWQRQWFQSRALEAQLDYWTKQLRGAHAFDLPADHPRLPKLANRGASYTFNLPEELSQALLAYSRQEGATLFMVLLAAFQVLLSRQTDQRDIVVGTDIANRVHVETEGLIGFFVNLLALRVQLEGQPLFHEVLQQVRKVVLEAYTHQDIPFDSLVEQLHLERSSGLTPLVNILFVMQNVPEAELTATSSELTISPLGDTTAQQAKFDAAFFLIEGAKGLKGRVHYNADLFEENTIALLVKRYEALLQSILAHPDHPIQTLELATERDKKDAVARRDFRQIRLKASGSEGIDLG